METVTSIVLWLNTVLIIGLIPMRVGICSSNQLKYLEVKDINVKDMLKTSGQILVF